MKPGPFQRIVRLAQLKAAASSRLKAGKISLAEYRLLSEQLDSLSLQLVQENPSEPLEELVSAFEEDPLAVPLAPFRRWLEEDRREEQAQIAQAEKPPQAAPKPAPVEKPPPVPLPKPVVIPLFVEPPPPPPAVKKPPPPALKEPPPAVKESPPAVKKAPPPPVAKPAPRPALEIPVLEDEPELLEAAAHKLAAKDRLVQQQSGWNKYLKPFLSENWMGLIGAVSLLAAWLLLAMWLYGRGHLSGYLIGYPPLALFTLGTAWLSWKMAASKQVVAQFALLSFLSIPFYFVLAGGLAAEQGIAGFGLAALSALGIPWTARRIMAPFGHKPTLFLVACNLPLFAALLAGPQAGLWLFLPGGLLALCWSLDRSSKAAPQSFAFSRTAFAAHYLLAGVMACLILPAWPDAGLFSLLLQPAAWAVARFWQGQPARLAGMGLSLLGILILVGLNSPLWPLAVLLAIGFWFLQWRSFGEAWTLEITAVHLPLLAWALGDTIGLSGAPLLWTAFPALTAAMALEFHAGRTIRSLSVGWPLFAVLTAAQAALFPHSPFALPPLLVLAAGAGFGYRALARTSQSMWLFNLFWTPACLYFCLPQETSLALYLAFVAVVWLACSKFLQHPLAQRSSTAMLWCYSVPAALALTATALGTEEVGFVQVAGTLAVMTALSGAARRSSSMLPVYLGFPPAALLAFHLIVEFGIPLGSGLGAVAAALVLLAAAPVLQRLLARSADRGSESFFGGKFLLVSQEFVQKPVENLAIILAAAGFFQSMLGLAPLTELPKLALAFPIQMAFWCLLALRRRQPAFSWPGMASLLGFLAALVWCFPWQLMPCTTAIILALMLLAAEFLQLSAHPLAQIVQVPLGQTSGTLLLVGVPLGLAADLFLMTTGLPLLVGAQALISALVIDRFLVRRSAQWSHLVLGHAAIAWGFAFWTLRAEGGGFAVVMGLDLFSSMVFILLTAASLMRRPLHALQARYASSVQSWLGVWTLLLALSLLSSSGEAWGSELPRWSFWAAAVAAAAALAHLRFGRKGKEEALPVGLAHICTAIGVMLFWPVSIRLLPFPAALPYLALLPVLFQLALLERGQSLVRRQASGLRLQEGGQSPSWRRHWAAGLLAAAAVVALGGPFFESLAFPGASFAGAALWRKAPALLLIGLTALRLNRHWRWSGFSLSGTVFAAAAAVLPAAQAVGPGWPRPVEAVLIILAGQAALALLYFPNPLRNALFRFAGLGDGDEKAYREQVFVLANAAIQLSALLLLFGPEQGFLRVLPLLALAVSGLLYHWRKVTVPAALLEAGVFLCLGMPVFYPAIPWQIPAVGLASLLALSVLLRRRPASSGWVPNGAFLMLGGLHVWALVRGGMLGLDSYTLLLFGYVCWVLLPDRPFREALPQFLAFWLFWGGCCLSLAADLYQTTASPLHLGIEGLISALLIGRFLVPRSRMWSHLALFHGVVFSCSAVWSWRAEAGGFPISVGLDLLSGTTLLLLAAALLLRRPLRALQAGWAQAVQTWLAGWSLLLALTLLFASGKAWGAAIPRESFWAAVVITAAAFAYFRSRWASQSGMRSAGLAHFSTTIGLMLFWTLSIRLLPFPAALPYLALAPALYQLARLERGFRSQAAEVRYQEGGQAPYPGLERGLSPSWRRPWVAGLLAAAAVVSVAHPLFEALVFGSTSLAGAAPWRNAPALLLVGLAALRLNRHWSWAGFSLSGTVLAAVAAVLPAAQALGPWLPDPDEASLTILTGQAVLALLFVSTPLRAALFRLAGLKGGEEQEAYSGRVFLLANAASHCSIMWLLFRLQPGDLRVLPLLALTIAGLLFHRRQVTVAAALLEAGLFLCLGMPVFYSAIPWQLPAVGLASLLALPVLLRRRFGGSGAVPNGVFLLLGGLHAYNVIQRGGILSPDSFAFLLFGFFCWALLPDRPLSVPLRYAHLFWVLWSGYLLLCLADGFAYWTFPAWALLCIWPPILLLWTLGGRAVLRPWAERGEKAIFELSLVAAAIGGLGLALDWQGILFRWPLVAALEAVLFTAVAAVVRRAVLQERRREPGHPALGSSLALAALAEAMIFSALGLLRWMAHLSELLDVGSPWDGYLLLGLAGVAAGIREVMRRETSAFDGFLSRATQLYAWIGWGWMLYLDLAGGGHLHGFTGAILLSGLYAWLARRGRRFNLVPAFALGNAALFLAYSDLDVYHPLLYIFPTVSSVLVLAQLLRDKLSESQMKSVRLSCSLVLLGSSAFYNLVAFENSLTYPLVAALVALVGVLAGISLRIRIYLYMGTFFFIFNTLAILVQIVRLQPAEHVKLLVGLLFLVTGLFFTGAYVAFQTRRQAILDRYQTLRGELSEWE